MHVKDSHMRIPWYLSILLMIGSVGFTWYLRTKDMNFFPESVVLPEGAVQSDLEKQKPAPTVGPPAPSVLSDEILSDDNVNPAINAYHELSSNLDALQRLFSVKLASNNVEDAYLAGERLLESPEISTEEKREVSQKMHSIFSKIRPWALDESAIIPASLLISGAPKGDESRKSLKNSLIELFSDSSGGMISLEVVFSDGSPSGTISIGENLSFNNTISAPVSLESITSSLYPVLSGVISTKYPSLQLASLENASANEFKISLTRHAWKSLLSEVVLPVKEEEKEESK